MRVGPCIPVEIYCDKKLCTVSPTSGPTWCLSHLTAVVRAEVNRYEVRLLPARAGQARLEEGADLVDPRLGSGRIVASEIEVPNILVDLV
jgi:hypothetical protein